MIGDESKGGDCDEVICTQNEVHQEEDEQNEFETTSILNQNEDYMQIKNIAHDRGKPGCVSEVDAISQHAGIRPCTPDVFNDHFWGQQASAI